MPDDAGGAILDRVVRALYFVVVLGACYSPSPQPGAPCGDSDVCPRGLRCIDHLCVTGSEGGDASPDVMGDAPGDAEIDAPLTGIQYVQGAFVEGPAPVKTLTLTLPQPATAGNLRVVFVSWLSPIGFQGVTDDRGAPYIDVVASGGGTVRMTALIAPITTSGTTTLTATWNSNAASPTLRVVEYRGVNMSDPIGDTKRNNGQGVDSTAMVSAAPGNVVVAANHSDSAPTLSPGPGFTERIRTAAGLIVEDMHPLAAGSVDAIAPLTASANWAMAAIVLR